MATIARFTVPSGDFPLGRIFADLPDATIELERIVPTTGRALPYFWVWGVDPGRVAAALEDDPALASVTLVDEIDGSGLFRATWNEGVEGLIPVILRADVTLLSATATSDNWLFEFRADDVEGIAEFQSDCRDRDIAATLVRVYALSEMQSGSQFELTPDQHEALLLAFERGYYDDDRDVSLQELGEELGISRPAVSARLRRGYRNLLRSTLAHRREPR